MHRKEKSALRLAVAKGTFQFKTIARLTAIRAETEQAALDIDSSLEDARRWPEIHVTPLRLLAALIFLG
jgi:hypothetical protein